MPLRVAFKEGNRGTGARLSAHAGRVVGIAARRALAGEAGPRGAGARKQAAGELWGKFLSRGFSTAPHDFLADGDKVVVLTTAQLGGEALESADVLTYNDAGKLVAFDTLGDPTIANRVFAS